MSKFDLEKEHAAWQHYLQLVGSRETALVELGQRFYDELAKNKGYRITHKPLTPGYDIAVKKGKAEVSAVPSIDHVAIVVNLPTISSIEDKIFRRFSCGGNNYIGSRDLILGPDNMASVLEATISRVEYGNKLAKLANSGR